MEKQYRIRTNVGSDKVLNVNLRQDVDILEILSVKLNQSDAYTLQGSNYGILVGRVLGNETFGVENAKVSIFISASDITLDTVLGTEIYPYTSVRSENYSGVRYNLLTDTQVDEYHRPVGTFPNKRLVLDDSTYLEVYDNYWKYTTTTNKAGDYMIFGVPSGSQQLHVDVDLSDIGILSQRPRDFENKGYNIGMFDNPSQFKASTNLDSLPQIFSQDKSVYIYPFWGDNNDTNVAITRCDVKLQYTFEPTCVFLGSIFTDDSTNAIGHNCTPEADNGDASQLISKGGKIETIRKTVTGDIEELVLQGNELIDGNGVWCYQIPMNLDYISTDEYGNIVPSRGITEGIPTRARVRFRFTLNEEGDESIGRHTARYLVPNNPELIGESITPMVQRATSASTNELDKFYEFGENTPDECFRDLLWNKVYSVKNYIPRFQRTDKSKSKKYTGIKSINSEKNKNNPIPFNKVRIHLPWKFRLLCILYKALIKTMNWLNKISVKCDDFPGIKTECVSIESPFSDMGDNKIEIDGIDSRASLSDTELAAQLGEYEAGGITGLVWAPGCKKSPLKRVRERNNLKCTYSDQRCIVTDKDRCLQFIEYGLAAEYDIYNLDFYNDWLNGSLYAPLWFWKKMDARRGLFGTWLFGSHSVNQFCSCNRYYWSLWEKENCRLEYSNDSLELSQTMISKTAPSESVMNKNKYRKNWHDWFSRKKAYFGLIKEYTNAYGVNLYYYVPGTVTSNNDGNYIRAFSTDIILLGSLNNNDSDGIPKIGLSYPSTTANIPPFLPLETDYAVFEQNSEQDGDSKRDRKKNDYGASYYLQDETGHLYASGLDFGYNPEKVDTEFAFERGLLGDIGCSTINTLPKTCINVERACELMTTRDIAFESSGITSQGGQKDVILPDGMISSIELDENDARSCFATMNMKKLNVASGTSKFTFSGYDTYKFDYTYIKGFDGRLKHSIKTYTFDRYADPRSDEYLTFRMGRQSVSSGSENTKFRHFYDVNVDSNGTRIYAFPLYENSFYFFFGLKQGSTAMDEFTKKYYSEATD